MELTQDEDMDSDWLWKELPNIVEMEVEIDRTTLRQEDGQWTADEVAAKKRKMSRSSKR
jgi:hypothetical protein